MKLTWDLTKIFVSTADLRKEMVKVKNKIKNIKKYENSELNYDLLYDLLSQKWEIKESVNKILIYASLKYYKNVHSVRNINLKNEAENFNAEVECELKFIDNKIIETGQSNIDDYFKKNKKLKTYKLYIDNLFRLEKHMQNENISNKIKDNNKTINNYITSYNNLLKDIEFGKIIIDGKEIEINNSNANKYISSVNRQTRFDTFNLVYNKYIEFGSEFANILNNIYKLRINNSYLEKYDSVLEKVLYEENIDEHIITNLIKSVNENIKTIQEYITNKTQLLNINEPHVYDINLPIKNNFNRKYTIEEAQAIVINALKPLGKKYTDTVKLLFDGHIDASPNKNKHQFITFSWNTYSFLNYRNSYNDLKNLIHEIGHIVNYYLSKEKQPFIYEDSTVFVGETASIVNELLLNKYLYENAKTIDEQVFYLSKNIENYFTSVFKQTMYTEFELELYKYASNKNLTSKILNDYYYKIIKKYYGDTIKYDEVQKIEWARLGHLFRWSYYPYKYATGLLIASIVVNDLTISKTISQKQYIEFLSLGSSMYSLDLLKTLNITLTKDKLNEGFNLLNEDLSLLYKTINDQKK